jgi:hypothetical protein
MRKLESSSTAYCEDLKTLTDAIEESNKAEFYFQHHQDDESLQRRVEEARSAVYIAAIRVIANFEAQVAAMKIQCDEITVDGRRCARSAKVSYPKHSGADSPDRFVCLQHAKFLNTSRASLLKPIEQGA